MKKVVKDKAEAKIFWPAKTNEARPNNATSPVIL